MTEVPTLWCGSTAAQQYVIVVHKTIKSRVNLNHVVIYITKPCEGRTVNILEQPLYDYRICTGCAQALRQYPAKGGVISELPDQVLYLV